MPRWRLQPLICSAFSATSGLMKMRKRSHGHRGGGLRSKPTSSSCMSRPLNGLAERADAELRRSTRRETNVGPTRLSRETDVGQIQIELSEPLVTFTAL